MMMMTPSRRFLARGASVLAKRSTGAVRTTTTTIPHRLPASLSKSPTTTLLHRQFHTPTPPLHLPITPDSSDPAPPSPESSHVSAPANISTEEYHERADACFEVLLQKLEQLAEQRDDVDVEYSAGVLTAHLPPKGTYVLNKQPPNKQIWLSSPISGPKRYDWVVSGEGQHQKEGGGSGDWVYARDGSTLAECLRREVGVTLDATDEV